MPMFVSLEFNPDAVRFPRDIGMETPDFFRCRMDAMINLSDPLAVLATKLAWHQVEAARG